MANDNFTLCPKIVKLMSVDCRCDMTKNAQPFFTDFFEYVGGPFVGRKRGPFEMAVIRDTGRKHCSGAVDLDPGFTDKVHGFVGEGSVRNVRQEIVLRGDAVRSDDDPVVAHEAADSFGVIQNKCF